MLQTIDKQDSLIAINESVVKALKVEVLSLNQIVTLQKKQIDLRQDNYLAAEEKGNVYLRINQSLVADNKTLKRKVNLFKGLSIGIPTVGLATLAYFTLR